MLNGIEGYHPLQNSIAKLENYKSQKDVAARWRWWKEMVPKFKGYSLNVQQQIWFIPRVEIFPPTSRSRIVVRQWNSIRRLLQFKERAIWRHSRIANSSTNKGGQAVGMKTAPTTWILLLESRRKRSKPVAL